MASSYSPSLKIELIGNGDQSGTWGTTTNNNLGTLLEQAITGVQSIVMNNANYVLTSLNGTSDEARNAVLAVTGTNSAIRQIVCPLVEKLYVVYNNTTGGYAITIGGASGATITIPNGITAQVYCDGTNFFSSQTGSAGNFTVNGTLTATGNQIVLGSLQTSAGLNAYNAASFTGIISNTTLTVSAVASGQLFVGQTISGTGITSGTTITAFGTGSGGVGTYTVSVAPSTNPTGSVTITGGAATTSLTPASTDNTVKVATTAFVQTSVNAALAVGTIQMWPTNTAPTGHLLCDGTAVSRTTYAALFAVIGTTFGAGDTTTTFNLPNYVNRMPFGANAPTTASVTGTINGAFFNGAISNGSGAAGTTLTVSSVVSGTIAIGQTISGAGITAGTTIVSGSGLSWVVSASQLVSSTTITSTGTTLTVSAVGSGTLLAGQTITGSGITANTIITAQLTGTTGGVGTYTVNISQAVASTTITANPSVSVGSTGGNVDAVVVSHTHALTDPGHVHGGIYTKVGSQIQAGSDIYSLMSGTTSNTTSAVTGITVDTAGVSGTNANLPPYLGINFIIKT